MKSTGIVRRADDLGRVVLPSEMRERLGIAAGGKVEMYMEGDRIILERYKPGCVLCDNADDLTEFHTKLVCAQCRTGLSIESRTSLRR